MAHNEDNYQGLLVQEGTEVFRIWGDGTLLDHPEVIPRVVSRVQAAVNEVYEAFANRSVRQVAVTLPEALPPAIGGNSCPRYAYDAQGRLTEKNQKGLGAVILEME